jgi:hypothetical protein
MPDALLERVRRLMREENVPGITVASLADLDNGRLSRYVRGQITLTETPLRRIRQVCDFIETIAAEAKPFPVCFHSAEKLRVIWDRCPHDKKLPWKTRGAAAD